MREVSDPRLRLVTLTRVDVAPDLSNALVFWSTLGDDAPESVDAIQAGLDGAASFLRSHLARAVELKRVPELRFRHDPSVERGSHTLQILREISDEQKR